MVVKHASFWSSPLFQRLRVGRAFGMPALSLLKRTFVGFRFSNKKVSLAPKISKRRRCFFPTFVLMVDLTELSNSPSLTASVGVDNDTFIFGVHRMPNILLAAFGAGLSTIPFRLDSKNTACSSSGILAFVFKTECGGCIRTGTLALRCCSVGRCLACGMSASTISGIDGSQSMRESVNVADRLGVLGICDAQRQVARVSLLMALRQWIPVNWSNSQHASRSAICLWNDEPPSVDVTAGLRAAVAQSRERHC